MFVACRDLHVSEVSAAFDLQLEEALSAEQQQPQQQQQKQKTHPTVRLRVSLGGVSGATLTGDRCELSRAAQ